MTGPAEYPHGAEPPAERPAGREVQCATGADYGRAGRHPGTATVPTTVDASTSATTNLNTHGHNRTTTGPDDKLLCGITLPVGAALISQKRRRTDDARGAHLPSFCPEPWLLARFTGPRTSLIPAVASYMLPSKTWTVSYRPELSGENSSAGARSGVFLARWNSEELPQQGRVQSRSNTADQTQPPSNHCLFRSVFSIHSLAILVYHPVAMPAEGASASPGVISEVGS
ncbi:hypothetical protein CKAH01_02298 [Colletotrichum kahawae]|uniref:Uncharacterized protein n=1 Tax=Colletotrichum kahawae TaxID=34407 RepID=A0AAE0CYJ7_COLKA|nr:hypothetical protein CKAH01_02298 [Colletotrichum kahawae]